MLPCPNAEVDASSATAARNDFIFFPFVLGTRWLKRIPAAKGLSALRLEGLLPDGAQRRRRSDRVGVDLQLYERRLAGARGALERRREILGALHGLAVPAEGARVRCEVRVLQVGAEHPRGILALLMHADGAVETVVHHQRHEIRTVLRRGGDLLTGHEEVAIAAETEHRALRLGQLRRDRRRIAVAHRAIGRAELGAE